ncbi:MAG: hypothetical protein ACK559_07315, partial [bacterium]
MLPRSGIRHPTTAGHSCVCPQDYFEDGGELLKAVFRGVSQVFLSDDYQVRGHAHTPSPPRYSTCGRCQPRSSV